MSTESDVEVLVVVRREASEGSEGSEPLLVAAAEVLEGERRRENRCRDW